MVKDEIVINVLLWTPSHGCDIVSWPTKTYVQQLRADTECSLEDLPKGMDDRDRWRQRQGNAC